MANTLSSNDNITVEIKDISVSSNDNTISNTISNNTTEIKDNTASSNDNTDIRDAIVKILKNQEYIINAIHDLQDRI